MKKNKKLTSRSNQRWYLLGSTFLGIILLGIFVYRQLLTPSTVALITEEGSVIKQCSSNIVTFTTQGSCSNGYVQSVTYNCKFDDKKGTEGSLGSCIDPELVFQHAQAYCGETCIEGRPADPTLTPTPSASPSVVKTAVPSPSIFPSVSPVGSAAMICPLSLSKWMYREACGKDQYRYVSYSCSGDQQTRVLGDARQCKSTTTWLSEARYACATNRCVITTTTTTTTSIRPTPTPTNQPLSTCYRSCRKTTTRSIWSCYSQCRAR